MFKVNPKCTSNYSTIAEIKKTAYLCNLIETKLTDLYIRGAINLISSNDTIADHSPETFQKLVDKHPTLSRVLIFPEKPENSKDALQVDSSKVRNVIQSFAPGSSGEIDGFSPQNLKDMISYTSGEGGQKLLESVTKLVNFLLRGELNLDTCPFIFGANFYKKRWRNSTED